MTSVFNNKERLIKALCKQELINNDETSAIKISQVVTLKTFKSGDIILNQCDCTDEMYFILSGKLAVKVNDRTIAYRSYGQTVGEMSLIDVGRLRSATVIAHESSELAHIEEEDFTKIADVHPVLWRNLAQSLACRLRERNGRERVKNTIPKIFIASSSEGKDAIEAIKTQFAGSNTEIISWTKRGLFEPSTHAIETLEKNVCDVDFAIIIIGPDDVVKSRGKKTDAPRDNIIFETGLFMGALGRRRVFMIESTNTQIKIPSDLNSLTSLRYRNAKELNEICTQIKELIIRDGSI